MSGKFKLVSPFMPRGDQPQAIAGLIKGFEGGRANQTLLGVTGSGKTFTMASVIEKLNRPVLVISPNKVLAAQLYSEFKTFFPENAVEYFISYYDYYQPEAYLPQTDTYIEKDASINEHIDKMRLKATSSILSRRDVIAVASVSCIYSIGSPENFSKLCVNVKIGRKIDRKNLTRLLVENRYERNDFEFKRGTFRLRGAFVDVFPADADSVYRIGVDHEVESVSKINPLTGDVIEKLKEIWIYPASHFVSGPGEVETALESIRKELGERLGELKSVNRLLEAQRLEQRTKYDIEMISQTGYCHGIENYSRHFSGRPPGSRPFCLLDYFPEDYVLFIDESHVSVPQARGMYEGDRSRKRILVDFGFRLPSALDNRPLRFEEFENIRPQTAFVSATPGPYELKICGKDGVAEQVIRPTGLIDPEVKILPLKNQIKNLISEIEKTAAKKERSLALTLTKKTAEDLSEYLVEKNIKARYVHSSMDTLARLDILQDFRKGKFDALIGINLLREGLDIPEVSMVAILNADNEGFLRSETTLIQIAGRAARNKCGRVFLFADRMTGSIKNALAEMDRRRARQAEYNRIHGIKPETIKKKNIELEELSSAARKKGFSMVRDIASVYVAPENISRVMDAIEKEMKEAADNLNFELAKELRDRLFELREMNVRAKRR
ncbi:MAG: excinuclease ABC subunit UvrB [Elusimicrobia bacterium]|nr:excinuclease ABC subunit UvrB [Elusimicrobiota bacterium]